MFRGNEKFEVRRSRSEVFRTSNLESRTCVMVLVALLLLVSCRQKMANQARSQWPKIMISDMNWGRITTWREMIAGFFDVPAQRPYLDEIGHVNIQYAITPGPREGRHGPVNRTQALLMAGWLAWGKLLWLWGWARRLSREFIWSLPPFAP